LQQLGKIAAMATAHKAKRRDERDQLTVSHRQRFIGRFGGPKLAADYLNAAAEEGDARVYLAASEPSRKRKAWHRSPRPRANVGDGFPELGGPERDGRGGDVAVPSRSIVHITRTFGDRPRKRSVAFVVCGSVPLYGAPRRPCS